MQIQAFPPLFSINAFAARQQKEAIETKDAQDRLNSGIKQHVEGIISKLEKTARKQKILAGILYAISATMLLATIYIAIRFLAKADLSSTSLEKVAVVGVVYLFVAILVVSFSKFLFTLAKSFMVEAIRCTDRIHAISFGLFYISAFDEKVTRDEVMKIFLYLEY